METFTLLQSKIFSKSYSIEGRAKSLQAKYQNEMTNDGCHFHSELKRWYNFWKDKVETLWNYNLVASLHPQKKILSIPAKDTLKIEIELFPLCAISHEN